MNDSDGVRIFERVGDLNADVQQSRQWQGAVVCEMRRQRFAFDKLHDDEVDAACFFDRVNGDNVGMVQDGRGLRFGEKPSLRALIASGVGRKQLERDVSAEFRILGTIHLAHPTFTYLVDDAVVQQLTFWFEGAHRGSGNHRVYTYNA